MRNCGKGSADAHSIASVRPCSAIDDNAISNHSGIALRRERIFLSDDVILRVPRSLCRRRQFIGAK